MNSPEREVMEAGKTLDRTTGNIEATKGTSRETHYHFPVTIEVVGGAHEEQIRDRGDTGRDTHYHFPVTIEMVGGTPDQQIRDIEDRLWARLAQTLNHTV